jgi:predicted RNase H-like nuclease (RuvC/YqgF family)
MSESIIETHLKITNQKLLNTIDELQAENTALKKQLEAKDKEIERLIEGLSSIYKDANDYKDCHKIIFKIKNIAKQALDAKE